MPQTFSKDERLCNFRLIEKLFSDGHSLVKYPFRVVYLSVIDSSCPPAQVLMSVSKRRFKRANKRNLIRRRMKEAYRLNKTALHASLESKNQKIALAIIYLPEVILSYAELEKGILKVFEHISLKLPVNNGPESKME